VKILNSIRDFNAPMMPQVMISNV